MERSGIASESTFCHLKQYILRHFLPQIHLYMMLLKTVTQQCIPDSVSCSWLYCPVCFHLWWALNTPVLLQRELSEQIKNKFFCSSDSLQKPLYQKGTCMRNGRNNPYICKDYSFQYIKESGQNSIRSKTRHSSWCATNTSNKPCAEKQLQRVETATAVLVAVSC